MKKKIKPMLLILLMNLFLLTACEITLNIPKHENVIKNNDDSSIENEAIEREEKYKIDEQEFLNNFLHKEIPDLKMKNINNEYVDIKQINGPFLLNFSRTDCPACLELYPIFPLANKEVEVIEVYYRDTKDEILKMIENNNFEINSNIISGLEDPSDNQVMDIFKLIAVPTTFFIDENKKVQHIEIGSFTLDEMLLLIDEYLYWKTT